VLYLFIIQDIIIHGDTDHGHGVITGMVGDMDQAGTIIEDQLMAIGLDIIMVIIMDGTGININISTTALTAPTIIMVTEDPQEALLVAAAPVRAAEDRQQHRLLLNGMRTQKTALQLPAIEDQQKAQLEEDQIQNVTASKEVQPEEHFRKVLQAVHVELKAEVHPGKMYQHQQKGKSVPNPHKEDLKNLMQDNNNLKGKRVHKTLKDSRHNLKEKHVLRNHNHKDLNRLNLSAKPGLNKHPNAMHVPKVVHNNHVPKVISQPVRRPIMLHQAVSSIKGSNLNVMKDLRKPGPAPILLPANSNQDLIRSIEAPALNKDHLHLKGMYNNRLALKRHLLMQELLLHNNHSLNPGRRRLLSNKPDPRQHLNNVRLRLPNELLLLQLNDPRQHHKVHQRKPDLNLLLHHKEQLQLLLHKEVPHL
jgi:hypothetical protein